MDGADLLVDKLSDATTSSDFSRFDGLRADEQAEFLAMWDTQEEIARTEQMGRLAETEWYFSADGSARIQHRQLDSVHITATEVVWGEA